MFRYAPGIIYYKKYYQDDDEDDGPYCIFIPWIDQRFFLIYFRLSYLPWFGFSFFLCHNVNIR